MSDQFGFRGVSHYGDSVLTDQLEASLHGWLTWSLLGVGAFENVARPQAGAWGGDRSRLRPALDPRYPPGTVWQAHRGDWCWESGVPYHTQPVPVTGVWVDGGFVPAAATGAYAHRVNYPLGQVVFASPVPTGAVVQAEYSPRFVQVRRADEPWFHQVAFNSFRNDDAGFDAPSASGGGGWTALAENRVQLPAVVVEPALNVTFAPYELGSTAGTYREAFLLHVLAETPWDRKRLHDLLATQRDGRIPTYDRNAAPYPLDGYGRPVPSALTYPQMCRAAPWRQARVAAVRSTAQDPVGRHLWWATVRYDLEVDLP